MRRRHPIAAAAVQAQGAGGATDDAARLLTPRMTDAPFG